jgi:NTP pyrophosphatase (non-canonical NTP hydrolase)
MKLTEYQISAHVTSNKALNNEQGLAMASMGLAGETGEVVDELKKILYHGKPLDLDKLAKEIGDVLWYVAELCTRLHIKLEGVAHLNLEKLRLRHGSSFKNHEKQNRSNDGSQADNGTADEKSS